MSYLVADVRGRPVSVLFDVTLLDQLRKLSRRGLIRRDARFRGVLYGRTDTTDVNRTLVTVETCESAHGLAPVGLVRSWVRGHLYLEKEDRDVLGGTHALQPYSVLLVVRPAMLDVPVAGAFLCESGTVTSENSFAEFPLDGSRILSGNFSVLKDAEAAAPQVRKQPVTQRGQTWIPRWAWIPIGALGVAILALFIAGVHRHVPGGDASPDASEPAGQPRILLSLQRAGNDLLLRWDPDNPTVRAAGHAGLRITDGNRERTIPLDSSQLAVGAAQYHPVSNDVEFQLDIPGPNGATSDPVRFISGPSQPERVVAAKSSELPGDTATNGESDRARVDSLRRSRASSPTVHISYEPIAPSAIRRAVYKVRGVPLLRFRDVDFVAPRVTNEVTPVVAAGTALPLPGEGLVQLRANVDKSGRVTNVQPLTSGADKQLVVLAENAIRHWRFNPARLNNRPAASSVRFTVRIEKPVEASQFASR